jgi:hypothetical protein
MANGFSSGGATAPYPSNGYPGVSFYGAGTPGRVGVTSGSSSRNAVSGVLPAVATKNHTIGIVIVVVGGYLLWHFSSRL